MRCLPYIYGLCEQQLTEHSLFFFRQLSFVGGIKREGGGKCKSEKLDLDVGTKEPVFDSRTVAVAWR